VLLFVFLILNIVKDFGKYKRLHRTDEVARLNYARNKAVNPCSVKFLRRNTTGASINFNLSIKMTEQNYAPVRNSTTLSVQAAQKPPKKTSLAYEGPKLSPEELLTEAWLPISGFEGRYEVSSLGRLRSTNRMIRFGRGGSRQVGGIKKTVIHSSGREQATLKIGRFVQRTAFVSRLVAIAFHPNPDQKPEVNHMDGNPLNNRASNLEWSTTLENLTHKLRNKLQPGLATETIKGICQEIVNRSATGITAKEIASKYGISPWTVHRISSNLNLASKISN
jgi:hypothetical protein